VAMRPGTSAATVSALAAALKRILQPPLR